MTTDAAKDTEEHKTCPHCAEQIRREAKVCKHCGKDIPIQNEWAIIIIGGLIGGLISCYSLTSQVQGHYIAPETIVTIDTTKPMCYGDNAFFSHIEKYLIYLKEGKFTLASEYVSDSNTLSGVIYQLTHHLRYTKGSDFSEISCLKDANIFNGVKWRVVSTEGSYVGL